VFDFVKPVWPGRKPWFHGAGCTVRMLLYGAVKIRVTAGKYESQRSCRCAN
jgi:hypothetical protein